MGVGFGSRPLRHLTRCMHPLVPILSRGRSSNGLPSTITRRIIGELNRLEQQDQRVTELEAQIEALTAPPSGKSKKAVAA